MKNLKNIVCRIAKNLFCSDGTERFDNQFLDLPNAPDFISDAPKISLAENIKLCEQMLHVWNANRTNRLKSIAIPREEFYL